MCNRLARKAKRAFTLIEILIVVVILGILAAIIIPQFAESAEAAQLSSAKTTLQTVRTQFELCKFRTDCNCGMTLQEILDVLTDDTAGPAYLQAMPQMPGDYALAYNATSCRIGATGPVVNGEDPADW